MKRRGRPTNSAVGGHKSGWTPFRHVFRPWLVGVGNPASDKWRSDGYGDGPGSATGAMKRGKQRKNQNKPAI